MILRAVALGTLFVVCWSSGFVGADLGTRQASALTLLTWRLVVATLVLGIVCAATRRRIRRADLRRHVPLGLAMQFGYLAGCYVGVEHGVPAATVALVAALQPLVVAVATPGRHTTAAQATGLLVGFGGVALVVGDGLGTAGGPAWAFLLPLGGMLTLAWGTIAAGRSPDRSDLVVGLTVQSAVSAAAFLVFALATRQPPAPATPAFAGAIAWLVILSGFGGYGAYLGMLRRHGPQVVSVLLYLTPPTTLLATWAMFGEPIHALHLAGMGLAALGTGLFLRCSPPAPPSPTSPFGREFSLPRRRSEVRKEKSAT